MICLSFFREKFLILPVSLFSQFAVRNEPQCGGIDAVPQAPAFFFRTIFENMPQMGSGTGAFYFRTDHPMGEIQPLCYNFPRNRPGKCRPAASGLVLVFLRKEHFTADDIHIQPFFKEMVVLNCIWPFCGSMPGDIIRQVSYAFPQRFFPSLFSVVTHSPPSFS